MRESGWYVRDWTPIRERYLRDNLPIRLGGLASNLARISGCFMDGRRQEVAQTCIEESKWFIEWTITEFEPDTAAQLDQLQHALSVWQLKQYDIYNDRGQCQQVGKQAREWSDRLLDLSGLLDDR